MKIMITGGAGFIGSHLVKHYIDKGYEVIVVDKFSYAAYKGKRLANINCKVIDIDLADDSTYIGYKLDQHKDVDIILHLAAETHVDVSITDPIEFVNSNIVGTVNLLEWTRKLPNLKKLIYFSTDEVYGPAEIWQYFQEGDRYRASNPYSATKAAAEQLCYAYKNTYGVPVVISRCMNVFGIMQHPEKFIPLVIKKLLDKEVITIHVDKNNKSGSRYYLHTEDVCNAMDLLIDKQLMRTSFNIAGVKEVTNRDILFKISKILGITPKFDEVVFDAARPGHDLRYALDGSRLKMLGFNALEDFDDRLVNTVNWYLNNKDWLEI